MQGLDLSLIVAMTPDRIIGNKGRLPWGRLPSDMAHFKNVTIKAGTVIMGRKTWESIPEKFRPLPERKNIVLSRRPAPSIIPDSTYFVSSVEEVIKTVARLGNRACVIGGEEIYRLFMPLPQLTRMYITVVHALNLEGDAYFLTRSEIKKEWICIEKTDVRKWNPGDEHETSVRLYERRE